MKTALAIRHIAFEDLGTLAVVLRQCGMGVTYIEAATGDLASIDPLGPDVVISLGGPMGAYEEHQYPFLADELRLLERRLAADRPTLGICLGAQLMARVLGAAVYPGHQPELGWTALELSAAGRRSPLRHIGETQTPVLHWHGDTFNLPDSAIRLAASPVYANQAFAWGTHALALQCHLEVTATGLERWWRSHANEIRNTPGVNVEQLRQDTRRYAPRLARQALRVWQEWLAQLQQHRRCF